VNDFTLGTGATIGRYFAVVSVLPSVLLAGWLYLLVLTGALTGTPELLRATSHLSQFRPAEAAVVAAVALLLAVALHPLQFTLVQLLEGYWGSSRMMRQLRARRTAAQIRRWAAASDGLRKAQTSLRPLRQPEDTVRDTLRSVTGASPQAGKAALQAIIDEEAWQPEYDFDPPEIAHFMPTRLGNTLRRHEVLAGGSYRLPVLRFSTHIGLVANPEHTAYVNDQRTQLDLAVRMCISSLFATVATFAIMWQHGLWLLLALVPYGLAWASYRGALTTARGYGAALAGWVDLNRFALYDALHLPQPDTTDMERSQNDAVVDMILGSDTYAARYEHSAALAPNNASTQ
jgi:hypothetical protein